jgi:tetratricopeptide (TPR) repeat protein
LQLAFKVELETDSPASEQPKRDATHSSRAFPLTVVLGDDYFTSSGDEISTAVDFAGKKILRVNPSDHSYQEISLYSDIGFRAAEFRNRLMLHRVLAAGKLADNPFDTVLMEHLFSLRAPDASPLANTGDADALTYAHGSKPLFSCGAGGTPVSPTDARHFIRFLRYIFAMHPDILNALEERKNIPTRFELYRYNLTKQHYHFVLVQAETVSRAFKPAEAIAGLKRKENDIDTVCALADAVSPAQFEQKCAGLVSAAVTEAKDKHYLDSLLIFLEYVLSTPQQQLPGEFAKYREKIQADPKAMTFLGAIKLERKEDAQKQADTMKSLRTSAHKSGYILKIHEANHLTAAGKAGEARQLFIEALRESPTIVGAWKDLGDLYYNSYQAELAWQCWDTGRRLAPEHKMFEPVNELERHLAKEHPEFF